MQKITRNQHESSMRMYAYIYINMSYVYVLCDLNIAYV